MYKFKKIINASQTRAVDQYTIKNNPISSIDLMENAANAFVQAFVRAFDQDELISRKIVVLCGTGNNGGDGFAVCRILKNKGINASAILVKFRETLSQDCLINKNRLENVKTLDESLPIPDFSHYDIIIDAILGSGLSAPVTGFVARVVEAINNAEKDVYSIDVPSGLPCDSIAESDCIVHTAHVISFQRPKLSFFLPENSAYIKTWEAVDIGLNESFIQEQDSNLFLIDESISQHVKQRQTHSHKGTYGHALLIAGSFGKMGAAILSAKACLRSGVGLLTCLVPKCGYEIMQISVPESMCLTDDTMNTLSTLPPEIKIYDSVGIGPGIGKDVLTSKMLEMLLKSNAHPLVLDADAINIISEHNELIEFLPKNTILTPHIKEFDRLAGHSRNTLDRLKKQQLFSTKHSAIIVLKGANTSISSPSGHLYFNTTGNPGMATAGSGDVLTGIIAGLLAQKYDPLSAAIISVYYHGKAGDQGVKYRSHNSLIASDIIEHLNVTCD